MTTPQSREKALQELLERAGWPEREIGVRLEQATSQDYWRQLCPWLSIGETPSERSQEAVTDGAPVETWIADLKTSGYFRSDAILDRDAVEKLRTAIEKLRASGWPPIFVYVFDEFWQVARIPPITRFLSGTLGQGYRQVPRVAMFYVTGGGRGIEPHLDYDEPGRLTLWFPVVDATLDNGCMYVVPRGRLPLSVAEAFRKASAFPYQDVVTILHCCRAVPAEAGSVIGWGHDVIHWGSVSSHQASPRISLAMTFAGEEFVPGPADLPFLLDPLRLPSFDQRLRTIAHSIFITGAVALWARGYTEFVARLKAALDRNAPATV